MKQWAIRRRDRAGGEDDARRILEQGVYGVLATSADGQPYATPLNYCLMDGAVYFHCAVEGRKLANLEANERVCFCVVNLANVLPKKFSIAYESALVFGKATEVFGGDKQRALEALVDKYSREFMAEGLRYIEKLSAKARVFRVSIDSLSAKKRLP